MEMTEIRAIVRALDGNFALVEVEQGGCGRCHEKGGCGGQHLTQALCTSPKTYRVTNPVGAAVGDAVQVGIPSGAIRFSANLAYGLPILGVFAGALIGMEMAGDIAAIGGAGVGLVLAWFIARQIAQSGTGNPQFQPQIISLRSTHS